MKTIGVFQLDQKKYQVMALPAEFIPLLGTIPENVIIIIYGDSGHGKTELAVRVVKGICSCGISVDWLSYEQGHGMDLQMAIRRNNMKEVADYFQITDPNWDKDPNTSYLDDLCEKIGKRGSPDLYVIDSIQYTRFTVVDYYYLKNKFKKKGFIFISHQDGSLPEGSTAKKILYDGGVGIRVKNYIAYPKKNRFGGTEPYLVWEERARLLEQKFFLERDKTANNAPKIAENSHEDRGVSAHD